MSVSTEQSTERTTDQVRQVAVTVSAVIAVVGGAIGSGAFGGTPIAEAGDGALSAEATFLAPDGPAFTIWTPIYVGLIGYALWQALPAHRADPRQRRVGWPTAVSMLLNAAWILIAQAGRVTTSVVVIVALLASLIVVYVRLLSPRALAAPRASAAGSASAPNSSGWVESVLLDGTFGLYLGWVSVATIANLTAALVAADVGDLVLGADVWAVLVLVVAIAVGLGVAAAGRGRLPYAVAMCWGLAWIAVGRSDGPDSSMLVALFAVAAVVIVALGTLVARIGRADRA
ncbi:MAG: tryptophan-rich sensory protein [Geodermatophilaceae bacterium]|nr:tryptophan-rich sensory protein [Geodermatophilaceae bacterium]